jgi:hypothetical protein
VLCVHVACRNGRCILIVRFSCAESREHK